LADKEVLIIDDEPQIRKLLEITLNSEGYEVIKAANAREGLQATTANQPDLIILDLGLPDEDGQSLLKRLRDWYTNPILILSVQDSETEIITALDNGANDYLCKPFRTGELLARIRSALRSTARDDHHSTMLCENVEINFAERTVKKKDEFVKLTSTEFSLLALLARNEGKVLTHQYLLREIWGPGYIKQSQYLRVFIAQLRKKIENDPNRPTLILTESGVGYRFIAKERFPLRND
jgi:two-component system, OmpR family, KDP operon response regulator KdpE